jgi:hypothetical protein
VKEQGVFMILRTCYDARLSTHHDLVKKHLNQS